MKKSLFVTLVMIFLISSSSVCAESMDFSSYTLDTLMEMRHAIDAEIAQKRVKETSTLTPASVFEGEILFRGIPWGTNANDVLKKLVADDMTNSNHQIYTDGYLFSWEISNTSYGQNDSGAKISMYSFPEGFNVAGYPLESADIECYFGYTEDQLDRSIAGTNFSYAELEFDVSDIELVFSDLTNKLSSLYGKPENKKDSASYIAIFGNAKNSEEYNEWNIWYGANNTGVYLFKAYQVEEGDTVMQNPTLKLVYARTNGKDYLNGIKRALENEKKAQDQLTQQNNADNVNGL